MGIIGCGLIRRVPEPEIKPVKEKNISPSEDSDSVKSSPPKQKTIVSKPRKSNTMESNGLKPSCACRGPPEYVGWRCESTKGPEGKQNTAPCLFLLSADV